MASTQGRLGSQLIQQGLITEEQLSKALLTQKALGIQRGVVKPLGEILIDLQLVTEADLLTVLGAQLNVPYIDVDKYDIDIETLATVPEKIAREKKVIPISRIESTLTLAMATPSDLSTIDEIEFLSGCEVIPVLGSRHSIMRAIERSYPRLAEMKSKQAAMPKPQTTDRRKKKPSAKESGEPAPFEGLSDEDLGFGTGKPVSAEARSQLDLDGSYQKSLKARQQEEDKRDYTADVDDFLDSIQGDQDEGVPENYEYVSLDQIFDNVPASSQMGAASTPSEEDNSINVGTVRVEDEPVHGFPDNDDIAPPPPQTAHTPRSVEIASDDSVIHDLIKEALEKRASLIYLEFDSHGSWVRYRIGSQIIEASMLDSDTSNSIMVTLKRLGKIDLYETRKPQSGIGIVEIDGNRLQLLIGSMPTITGESMMVRILGQKEHTSLTQLGMNSKVLQQLRHVLHQPYGTILLVGPAGSGKTATTYGIISEFDHAKKKIVDIQTTIDRYIPTINQVQVFPNEGISYASVLQSVAHHQPDVVVLGEMADLETTEAILRIGLSSVVVTPYISTAAYQAINGLKSIGLDAMLLGTSLRGILNQRLVRKICQKCKTGYKPPDDIAEKIKASVRIKEVIFYKGKGCETCQQSGFEGELMIYEFAPVTTELRTRILTNTLPELLEKAIANARIRSLKQDALEKVLKGLTTFEEMTRVI